MVDTKISSLTALATADDDADVLPIVDDSATLTKKVSVGALRQYEVDAITVTGSLTARTKQLITLNSGSAIALTILAAPAVGDELEIVSDGSVSHTVIVSGSVTWDGTNTTSVFSAADDRLRCIRLV